MMVAGLVNWFVWKIDPASEQYDAFNSGWIKEIYEKEITKLPKSARKEIKKYKLHY